MKASVVRGIFAAGVSMGLLMVLIPNSGENMHGYLPASLRSWVNWHDDLANCVAFFVVALFAFLLPARAPRDPKPVRLAVLLASVCAIEFVQHFIPGRVADLQDVCTGSSGIFAAWLLCTVCERPARHGALASPPASA